MTEARLSDLEYILSLVTSSNMNNKDKKDAVLKIQAIGKYIEELSFNESDGIGEWSGVNDQKDDFWEWLNRKETDATTTYIPELDYYFKWKNGWVNVWTGYANEGKSSFLYFLILLRMLKEPDTRVAVFSPENYPRHKFVKDWIKTIIAKDPKYSTELECRKAIEAFNERLFYVYPASHDIDTIETQFRNLILLSKVNIVVVDPYLKVTKPTSMNEVAALADFVKGRELFAKTHNVSYNVVYHQLTPYKDEKTGEYVEPDMYRIKGGGNITDGSDAVCSVYRPKRNSDPSNPKVRIRSQKIKDFDVAKPGYIDLDYNLSMNRYFYNNVDLFSRIFKQEDNELF